VTRRRRERIPHPAHAVAAVDGGWWVWCPACGFESRSTGSEAVARGWRDAHRTQTPTLTDNHQEAM
jgi:hypothetical protein